MNPESAARNCLLSANYVLDITLGTNFRELKMNNVGGYQIPADIVATKEMWPESAFLFIETPSFDQIHLAVFYLTSYIILVSFML